MKVKELIAQLQELNGELEVICDGDVVVHATKCITDIASINGDCIELELKNDFDPYSVIGR